MLQAEKLILMNVVLRKKNLTTLLAKLLGTGFFHPFDANAIADGMQQVKPQQQYKMARWDAVAHRYKEIVDKIRFSSSNNNAEAATYLEAESTLEEIEEDLTSLMEKRTQFQQQLSNVENVLSKRPVYLQISINLEHTFIHIEYGEIETRKMPLIETLFGSTPHVVIPVDIKNKSSLVFVIILKKDISVLEKIKKELAWIQPPDIVITDIPVEEQRKRAEGLRSEIERIDSQIRELSQTYRKSLEKIAVSIDIHEKFNQANENICATETVTLLSGWIPQQEQQTVSEIIQNTDPISHTEFIPAKISGIPLEEIPVKMNHNKFLKPFELIVGTYGIPRYSAIDPTLFVAISFLLMFGAMFGDIGHGLVFVLAGIMMLWRMRGPSKQAGALLAYIGLSSILFGFLYGSFFGIEFHPLWIKPMDDVFVLFRVCIAFGITLLTAGIFINIANFGINKNMRSLLFDKSGLFSGLIYWAGIGLIAGLLARPAGIYVKLTAILFGIGIVTIFANSVIEAIQHKDGMLVGFIEGLLHIFEITMGYLANTVSFIRISAFALNHFGFFMTIFAISDMLKNADMSVLSLPFVILGNIFVLFLEGLVVMIQCLRLNYYEFFSRFFVSGKRLYNPLTLKTSPKNIKQYLS